MMVKSQQLQSKEQELTEVKNDLSRVIDSHRAKINEYEDDLKTVKRQLAEE
jgi:DNA gyrase/topoisomerase IV subunit A